ncbi:SDR family NAD(P)-dependent oxidoreductase [Sphingobium sp. DEHP117]|nr:SDR family oxidoreductase [Sphingobium sp. DEHP117]MDQ4420998.1 SDR family NAD(P)-dependent oxidoreductase [Sphingobium sp. DEHP117]
MGAFENKSILVTGAGSGIGRATAHLFAAEGAGVLAVDISCDVEETAAGHERIVAMRGDAGHEPDVIAMIAATATFNGGVDVICANAGVSGGPEGLFDQAAADWEALLRVNLIGPFLAIKHGARAMIEAGRIGAIVCTASVAGLRAGAGGPAYSASKAGVINLAQTAAQQLAGTGIRVNAVCPGLIETGMTQPIYERARAKHREDRIGQLNPLRRGGSPVEIASAIAFLASDAASYVNGHALVVDAGLSTSHPFAKPLDRSETTF